MLIASAGAPAKGSLYTAQQRLSAREGVQPTLLRWVLQLGEYMDGASAAAVAATALLLPQRLTSSPVASPR